MSQRVNAIKNGFDNCVFVNKDIDKVIKTLTERISEHDVFTDNPQDIKMSRIDDTHDRLSLTFSNGTLDGIVTWTKTSNDLHYLFHFDVAEN